LTVLAKVEATSRANLAEVEWRRRRTVDAVDKTGGQAKGKTGGKVKGKWGTLIREAD
jgi:hypothetical protein